jgi:regulator of protease activity HflC (stomatin/prohibitin superfamily)
MEYVKKSLLILSHLGSVIIGYSKKKLLGLRSFIQRNLPYFAVFFLTLTLSAAFLWSEIVITINSGEGGVLFRRFFGTDTEKVYTEGVYAIFPWDTMYIYDARIQTVLHDFDVLTMEGLTIHLSLAIRFRPEYDMLGLLHQQVGPDYVNTIITPEVESVLRKRLSPYKPEDIYKNKDKILTTVVIEAMDVLGQKYVTANDVIIREISLPETIVTAIENKLKEEQQEQAYVYRLKREKQEAERKMTEATGIKNYQDTVSKSLTDKLLKWQGIQATLELAKSNNSKVVVIGAGNSGMPLILGSDYSNNEPKNAASEKPVSAAVEPQNPAPENVNPAPPVNDAN